MALLPVRQRQFHALLSHAHADKEIVDRYTLYFRERHSQQVITDRITHAVMMIADISEENLNTCIEASIARGAGQRFHLVACEPRRRPPFIFRDQQVWYYANDIELLALIHRIAYPYRRRVVNWELPKLSL